MIHYSMTDAEYNALDAERWTHISAISVSLRHYLWKKRNGISDTVSMREGRAVHCSVLEPEKYQRDYVVYPARRAGKDWVEFQADNEGKCFLNESESTSARLMANSLLDYKMNARATELLAAPGRRELVVEWPNSFSHMPCKARIDLLTDDGDKVEVKTAKEVTPEGFGIQCHRLGYLGQDAFYREGLAANGIAVRNSYFVIVESKAPFDVAVYRIGPDERAAGERLVGTLTRKLGMARQSHEWPGVCPTEMALRLPHWAEGDNLEMQVDGELETV